MENDIQIQDVEDFKVGENTQFSHQSLVMRAMTKALDFGCREMHDGYNEIQTDGRGNKKIIYKEDTKLAFIESVKSCLMIMACDFDKEFEDKQKEVYEKLEKLEPFYLKQQKKYYDTWDDEQEKKFKKQFGEVNLNYLDKNLPQYYEYTALLVDAYRELYAELSKLTKRLDFYQEADWSA